jgi:hypothetical protein
VDLRRRLAGIAFSLPQSEMSSPARQSLKGNEWVTSVGMAGPSRSDSVIVRCRARVVPLCTVNERLNEALAAIYLRCGKRRLSA